MSYITNYASVDHILYMLRNINILSDADFSQKLYYRPLKITLKGKANLVFCLQYIFLTRPYANAYFHKKNFIPIFTVVVVDQFTPGYQFRPTPNFLEDL